MSVAVSVETIVPELTIASAPIANVVPITTMPASKRKRLGLFTALTDVGCEIVSLCLEGVRDIAASRPHDALADAHVKRINTLAQRGAEESAALHGCPCHVRFLRIIDHGNGYFVADAAEDAWVARGASAFDRIREIARGMNRALTRELARRGWPGATQ